MTFLNESNRDRTIRLMVGVLALVGAWSVTSGLLQLALAAGGVIAIGTAIVGWCPAYSLLGFATRKAAPGHGRPAGPQ